MLLHYLIIASRNFIKYKLQTLVSIVGLAIGLVCFTFGMKWLDYETSYDGFYPQSKQMYTLYGINKQTGKQERELPIILSKKIKQDFPEVKEVTVEYGNYGSPFKYNGQRLGMQKEIFIQKNFFTLFPRKVICGRQTDLLQSADEMVVNRSFAQRYFKSPEEAIDKVMSNAYKDILRIVAVVEDAPANSMFQQEIFELDIFNERQNANMSEDIQWQRLNSKIFLMLEKNASAKAFDKKLQEYLAKNNYLNTLVVKMIPLTDMRHTFGSELTFNITYIRTFAITTLLL